jgi:hypothetical protein
MSDEEKRGPGRPPKVETVRAEVLRDYWTKADEDGGRVRAGTVVDVSKDDLIAGMEKGLLRRVD